METLAIKLPTTLYHVLSERAAKRKQTPAHFVEELLAELMLPSHPYVEIIESRSGPRAIVKGTRTGVDIVIGYIKAGYTPDDLASELLPHLTLAQIYDVLSYYEDHQTTIDELLQTDIQQVWQHQLTERLGKAKAAQLLGQ